MKLYEIAEWSDFGFWVIAEVGTEQEAIEEVARLNDGGVFMTYGYKKKEDEGISRV